MTSSFQTRSRLLLIVLLETLFLSWSTLAQASNISPVQAADNLKMGRERAANGDWKGAEEHFRVYKSRHPDSGDAIVLHARSLVRLKQPYDAVLELRTFLQTHTENVAALRYYGVLLETYLKETGEAESMLEKSTRLAPRDPQAWTSLGDVYLTHDKNKEAARCFQRASALKPDDPIIVASLAYTEGLVGEIARVKPLFARAIELNERAAQPSAAVDLLYGRYLADAGQSQGSVVVFNRALSRDPNSVEGLYRRAQAYHALKDLRHAESDALSASRLAPRSKEPLLFLMKLYQEMGNESDSERYAGMVQNLSDEEEAHHAMDRSVREELDQAEPLLRAGQFSQAAPHFQRVVELLPAYQEAYFDLGVCLSQTGRNADAEASFRKYLSMQPVSADAHAALGVLLLQQDRGAEAVPELQRAIEIDPEMNEVRQVLASEWLRQMKPQAAVSLLEGHTGHDIEMQTLLAIALGQAGNRTAALREINRVLAVKPDDPGALKEKQELLSHKEPAKTRF